MTTDIQGPSVSIEHLSSLTPWQLHERVIDLRDKIQRTFIELGQILVWMRDGEIYKQLGHDTFNAYLASPELDLSERQLYRILAVVTGLADTVAAPDLAEIGVSKAEMILPLIRDAEPETVESWVADAKGLSRSDLRRKVRDATEGELPDSREWLDELASLIIGKMAKLSRADDPLNLLDETVVLAMGGVERLKSRAE